MTKYRSNADGSAVCPHAEMTCCPACVASDASLVDVYGAFFHSGLLTVAANTGAPFTNMTEQFAVTATTFIEQQIEQPTRSRALKHERVVASDRRESESCEAGTKSCCIDHTQDDGGCDTW